MSFSSRTMRAEDWNHPAIRGRFGPNEFKSPDKMGYEFILWLSGVRDYADVPMHITSSFRSKAYNAAVGGAQDSAHSDEPCNAVDIGKRPRRDDPNWNYSRWRIITAAMKAGCVRIGMYPGGSLHLDRTEEKRPGHRIWIAVDNPA